MADSSKRQIEHATIWALIGIFATVVIGVPGIYYAVHEKRPHVTYEIVGNSKVLDVHQPVKDLEIRYHGEDIYALKKDLSILTITIRNDGETHILQSDFDQSMPWGLQIKRGQIVDVPKLVNCNSDYLQNHIDIQSTTNNLVIFQKIIFDRETFFTVQLQVLHPSDEDPEINVIGKIAGIDTQAVVNNLKDDGTPGLWSQIFYGSLKVQLARIFVYVAGTVLLIIAVVLSLAGISELRSKNVQKKIKRKVDAFLGPVLEGKDEKARATVNALLWLSRGKVKSLKKLRAFLSDTGETTQILEKLRNHTLAIGELRSLPSILERTIQQRRVIETLGKGDEIFRVHFEAGNHFLPDLLTEDSKVAKES
ncbi:MAG TPA: hypothetical protein VH280_03135 [Verrucomicrobiae bacterium]|jgi:hypothetical protein|nr:hypothetical protein [Verrucomicrobiae bacterium]